jgi:hypothetical protein
MGDFSDIKTESPENMNSEDFEEDSDNMNTKKQSDEVLQLPVIKVETLNEDEDLVPR